jgi:hypothetical protein
MAGRVANDKLDATFHPYSKSNEPQKREPTKAAGGDVPTVEHPIVQDSADGKGSARSVSGKGKNARKKSNVCCQFLS